MVHEVKRTFAGRPLHMQTGRLAKQAAGSALVRFGDTVVLAAVTVSDKISHLPFFPLTVEYREKTYAAGKFPGGFIKREGRPSDDEILAARQIDRSVRPLFAKGFKNETQIFVYVLSADQENDADTVGLIAASLALSVSKVPWNGPVAAVRMGRTGGEWIVNPTFDQIDESDLDLVVAGRKGSVMMVEGGALELSEEAIAEAIMRAQEGVDEILGHMQEVIDSVAPVNMDFESTEVPSDIASRVREIAEPKMKDALFGGAKAERQQNLASLRDEALSQLAEEFPDDAGQIKAAFADLESDVTRAQITEHGERVDGRGLDTVRPIECEVGLLCLIEGHGGQRFGPCYFLRSALHFGFGVLGALVLLLREGGGLFDPHQRVARRIPGDQKLLLKVRRFPTLRFNLGPGFFPRLVQHGFRARDFFQRRGDGRFGLLYGGGSGGRLGSFLFAIRLCGLGRFEKILDVVLQGSRCKQDCQNRQGPHKGSPKTSRQDREPGAVHQEV